MARKIAVLGAGAIGGVISGYLARAGHDITVIDQWPENVEAIRSKGLTVTSMEEEFTVQPPALHLCDVSAAQPQFDTVILAVKSYDTDWMVRFIQPYLSPTGFIVSAQNSINDDRIAAVVGWTREMGCVITLGAGMYEAGHALRTSPASRPAFTLGEPTGMVTPRLKEMAEVLGAVGTTKTTANLWGERWSKLAVNSMANAIAGITGLKSAELRENTDARRVSIRIAAELVQVGTALGVSIEPISGIPAQMFVDATRDGSTLEEVESRLMEGSRQIGTGRPSLAQDVMKGRKTEVDYLNGYVVEKGRAVGIPTPVNEAVVKLTKQVEGRQLPQSLSNLKGLV